MKKSELCWNQRREGIRGFGFLVPFCLGAEKKKNCSFFTYFPLSMAFFDYIEAPPFLGEERRIGGGFYGR